MNHRTHQFIYQDQAYKNKKDFYNQHKNDKTCSYDNWLMKVKDGIDPMEALNRGRPKNNPAKVKARKSCKICEKQKKYRFSLCYTCYHYFEEQYLLSPAQKFGVTRKEYLSNKLEDMRNAIREAR